MLRGGGAVWLVVVAWRVCSCVVCDVWKVVCVVVLWWCVVCGVEGLVAGCVRCTAQITENGLVPGSTVLPQRHTPSVIEHFIPEVEFLEAHKLELDNYLKVRGAVCVLGVGVLARPCTRAT